MEVKALPMTAIGVGNVLDIHQSVDVHNAV